ncbi:MAG: hypothetical protein JXB04_00370 [Kiritimatiellae bacterium]|nr:hypothetical protein [Kiritimatiellia bacterium]
MRKFVFGLVLFACAALLFAPFAFGAAGIIRTYVQIDNGSAATWYDCYFNDFNPSTTDFDGLNLGTFTEGDTLTLSGGEVGTYDDGPGGWDDTTGAAIFYRVYAQGSTPGAFTQLGLGWTSDSPYNDASGQQYTGAGDQKWAQIASTPSLLLGLSGDGVYYVEFYHEGYFQWGGGAGTWTETQNNGGSYFQGYFTYDDLDEDGAIPEPGSISVAMMGAVLVMAFRHRRNLV